MTDHDDERRRRAAQIAEIEHTPDWDRVMRDTNCPAAHLIPDGSFAAYKSIYTKRGGESAPWSDDPSPNIGDRIARRGTIAYKAYHGLDIEPTPRPEISPERLEELRRKREERRRDR